MRPQHLAPLAAVAALLCADAAHAGGFHITIFGSRRTGMLANMGAPDDGTALFHNPAGLADQKGARLHVSGSSAFLSTRLKLQALDPVRFPDLNPRGCGTAGNPECPWPIGPDGYYTKDVEPVKTFGVLPYLGFSHDLGFVGDGWEDVVVGASITAPNLYGATLPGDAPTAYFFTEGYFIALAPIVGAGWRINEYVSVGANFQVNYLRLKYGQKFSMADLLRGASPTADDIATADLAQLGIGDVLLDYTGSDTGFGWTLSTLLSPTRWLDIGLGYSGATAARFRGDVHITPVRDTIDEAGFEQALLLADYKLPTELVVEMPIPSSFQSGVRVKVNPRLEVGLDYRIWMYQVFKTQVMEPLYPDGPGREPITTAQLSKDKSYRASWELGGGVLGRPWDAHRELELMCGFGFDQSPVKNRTFSIDNPSMSQLVYTGGVRWFPEQGLRIGATYMYLQYLERDVTTSEASPPLNVRGRGGNHMPRLEVEYVF